jgi:hypothetical protein
MRVFLLFLLTLLLLPSIAFAKGKVWTENFASDQNWRVYTQVPSSATRQGPTFLGNAQHVCLNATAPVSCPAGATLYGHPGSGWRADLAAIPDARWIWAPGVTGATTPADLARYVFARDVGIPLRGVVTQAWLWVSTDDLATVYVNGTLIGTVGSITNPSVSTMAQNALTRFNIAAALKGGRNTVAVVGQNGPPSFGPCAVACSYAQNPAGTVLGGYVKYVLPRKP